MHPRHQMAFLSTDGGEFDRPLSTHSAVGDTAKDVLNGTSTKLCVDVIQRCIASQRAIRPFQPSSRHVILTQIMLRESNDACEPIQAVRFKPGQPSLPTSSLQASRRKIQARGQLFQCETGALHHLVDNYFRKTISNGGLKISLILQRAPKNRLTAEFLKNGVEFINHFDVYYSAKCRTRDRPCLA